MAARSPVTIESSPSCEVYQPPSITPESFRRSLSSTSVTRSSPQLLSPSAFLRPRAQPLKSGSRAQQVPAGAHAGFASAASLWKVQGNEESAQLGHGSGAWNGAHEDGTKEGGERASKTKGTGKLTRPRKAPKSRKPSVSAGTGSESPRFDSFIQPKADTVIIPGPASLHTDKARSSEATVISRRPSINISEYSFKADVVAELPTVPAKNTSSVKKPARKRVSKGNDQKDTSAPKKPRKTKAKSEAIILDSDEPEVSLAVAETGEKEDNLHVIEAVAKKPRAKAVKKPARSKAKADSPTLEVSKETKDPEVPKIPTKESAETSSYFALQAPSAGLDRLPSSPPPALCKSTTDSEAHKDTLAETPAADFTANTSLPPAELAPRRRRSWTPVQDSLVENETNTIPVVNYELNENMGQIPFSEMLGNFSYLQTESDVIPRAADGEARTKRRRAELSQKIISPPVPPKDTATAKPVSRAVKAAKKPKAIPKKPQTITERATEAYRPAKVPDPEQSTISAHFTPRKEVEIAPVDAENADGQEIPVKVKKPRKSRAKVQPVDGDAAPSRKPAKPKAKTTKVKVKFDKNDHQAPLYSPTQACKQMRSQDFLFWTSSQLAADDSPEFIREIQLAVQQSEMVCGMPQSSQIGTQLEVHVGEEDKSCVKVPTAPHGTCLSLEQAGREHWCQGTRDETGSKLMRDVMNPHREDLPAVTETAEDVLPTHDVITVSSSLREDREEPAIHLPQHAPPLRTSPALKPSEAPAALAVQNITTAVQLDDTEHAELRASDANNALLEENWMLLGSDDSIILPQTTIHPPPERPTTLLTSPARRIALQPLDANILIAAQDLAGKFNSMPQTRPFSTTTASPERDRPRKQIPIVAQDDATLELASPKRGRGRPRKELSPDRVIQTSPKRGPGRPRKEPSLDRTVQTSPARGRGRPRKEPSLDRPAQTSPTRGPGRPRKNSLLDKTTKTSPVRRRSSIERRFSASPMRPVGRPRKVVDLSDLMSTTPKRPVGRPRKETLYDATGQHFRKIGSPVSSSQPASRQEWTRTDDISDCESPTTPSPRRRRASSSPAFMRPLDFEEAARSPPAKPRVTGSATVAIKATDVGWPAIQATIFPRIANAIQSAPLGKDMAAPSWHEKILLYDPIVLEDLTAWLNKQGLRTELERLKPKVKTKGRKRKDAVPEVDEWEVVRDELKPWMVQKWCEDNSICCLWKEGLRGGVKAKY